MRRQLIWALLLVARELRLRVGAGDDVRLDHRRGGRRPGRPGSRRDRHRHVEPGQPKTFRDRLRRPLLRALTSRPACIGVKVELTGFSPVEQKNIDVRLGQRLDLGSLTLKVGGLEEVVEVVGSAPVDRHLVDDRRRHPRHRSDRAAARSAATSPTPCTCVPGVSDQLAPARPTLDRRRQRPREQLHRRRRQHHRTPASARVGSYSIAFGSLGTGVTTDFIKETQVKTGGFEAEYGQATGGVVNVVTQSGTNEFHGALFGYLPARRPRGRAGEQLETAQRHREHDRPPEQRLRRHPGRPAHEGQAVLLRHLQPPVPATTFIARDRSRRASRWPSLGEVDRKRKTSPTPAS